MEKSFFYYDHTIVIHNQIMLNSNYGKISKYKRKLNFIYYLKYLTNKVNIKLQLNFTQCYWGFLFLVFFIKYKLI